MSQMKLKFSEFPAQSRVTPIFLNMCIRLIPPLISFQKINHSKTLSRVWGVRDL
jgi:hypothetical protein